MSETDNENYGTIEKQFNRIRDYVIGERDPINLQAGYDNLNISDDLKIKTQTPIGMNILETLFMPSYLKLLPFLKNEESRNNSLSFIFGFGQDNFENFLNNEQIDNQDKFSALVTKYAIVSQLPDKFKSTKNKEMELLYNHAEEVSKNYANYISIKNNDSDILSKNDYILGRSLSQIINNIFPKEDKTDYAKDIKFIIDIYKNIPLLTKDRIVNFQGQSGFDRLIQRFLENPHRNNDIISFFKGIIQEDPSCIYKFSTTSDKIDHEYEQIEKNGGFSGNFICNFPDALNENGKISCEETRCKYNILSDILYTLNYKEFSEDGVKDDIVEMLNFTLESLSNHIRSLRENNNLKELQKINYLLNCPIEDPNTEEILTPMDLIDSLVEKNIIAPLTDEQKEQFRTEPVYLQTIEGVKNSREFKQAVARKQKEVKAKEEPIPLNKHRTMEEMFMPEVFQREADEKETKEGNEEIKELQDKLESEKEKTKSSSIYKFFNFFSKTFLKRETKYKTRSEILAERELAEKIIELSEPFFASATKIAEGQRQTLDQDKSKEQIKNIQINNDKNIEIS